jgi:hypothetical protein
MNADIKRHYCHGRLNIADDVVIITRYAPEILPRNDDIAQTFIFTIQEISPTMRDAATMRQRLREAKEVMLAYEDTA